MKRYDPASIEPKWQKVWDQTGLYEASEDKIKPKNYILDFFPYPSGAAMHVGHVRNYTISDALARFARQRGQNVLHPMGWDAFGLPAENYAIKTGMSPQQAVKQNTYRFKQQLTQMGIGIDWSREINSTDPGYYRWTQCLFAVLFERGLAYQKESLQWWCETDKTVLANEQVEAGRCWRCGNVVTKKPLKQWFFKITEYADRLATDLDDIDWSDPIKSMQRNWIGRSVGAEVDFAVEGRGETVKIFTTRADTLFGATFVVLAPEHPLAKQLTTSERVETVEEYIAAAIAKSDIDRMDTEREKTGVFTGSYAINPVNGAKVPIWIADYVLTGYGTGAIMAVPGHDERDFAFATAYKLPIVSVVAEDFGEPLPDAKEVEGVVVIGYDPRVKKFLGLKNGDMGWLVGGGREKGETFEATARRELAEEAGYETVEALIPLGDPVYSYYYNDIKKSNRRSLGYNYLAILDSEQPRRTRQEAHESFKVQWAGIEELYTDIEKTGGGVEHWLDALRKARAAAEAYEQKKELQGGCYRGEGVLINSESYSGMSTTEAREKIISDLTKKNVGKERVNYKIRDWLISRQRYWGAPIPIIHCEKDGAVAIPLEQLPVELPVMETYEPSGDGRSPLARVPEWVNTTCPKCGGPAKRETDTMDGFACSSWYFLRFADPHNDNAAFDRDKVDHWLPVDTYVGGAEHAVMHLLYARFWTKVLYDAGLINFSEPFTALRNQGMIWASDGRKMSKSFGNTIAPDDLIADGYGADAIRVMELFIAPWNQGANWSTEGLGGCYRFLQRVWTLIQEYLNAENATSNVEVEAQLHRATHKTTRKVTEDLHSLGFNTAIAAMMEYVNQLYKIKVDLPAHAGNTAWQAAITTLAQLLAPFAPHLAEELWHELGHKDSVHVDHWPTWDEKYLVADTMTIVVQVNGKVRARLEMASESSEQEITKAALANDRVIEFTDNKKPTKVIYVPGRLMNIVVR